MTFHPVSLSLVDAVQKGDLETVRQHLAVGADPDSADSVGRSALYHAAFTGHEGIVKALLAKNADAASEDDVGETPFIAALSQGHFGIAALLLEAGADINSCSGRQGQPPLHWAFHMDLKDEKAGRVLWLLDKGADPHRKSGDGLDVLERARDYERKWPFAGELLGHMEELIKSRDPDVIRARELRETQEELCASLRGGLKEDMQVRAIRLQFAKPKNA